MGTTSSRSGFIGALSSSITSFPKVFKSWACVLMLGLNNLGSFGLSKYTSSTFFFTSPGLGSLKGVILSFGNSVTLFCCLILSAASMLILSLAKLSGCLPVSLINPRVSLATISKNVSAPFSAISNKPSSFL